MNKWLKLLNTSAPFQFGYRTPDFTFQALFLKKAVKMKSTIPISVSQLKYRSIHQKVLNTLLEMPYSNVGRSLLIDNHVQNYQVSEPKTMENSLYIYMINISK